MLIQNLWEAFLSENSDGPGTVVPAGRTLKPKPSTELLCSAENPSDAEICQLANHFGGIHSGMKIEMTLQELLEIIPHKRRRCDSYATLIKKLETDFGVTLEIIKSHKAND